MGIIKRIEIRNFRSIHHLILENDILNLNTFVGDNDIGKSNILRALNLFFNSETEIGKKFSFWEEFNKNIERKSGRGQYIKIILDIDLKYENQKIVKWTKTWDNLGELKENTQDVYTYDWEQSDFIENSRAKGWLNRIKFRYVPANKSPQYFQHLFEELHDILSSTYADQFEKNTQSLISTIQDITADITSELKDTLLIENKISIPSTLRSFFGTLDFSIDLDGKKFNLSERGDGIKVRHIPIILKFLADKAKQSKQGALDIQTIWGFEEPENNLEMSRCFDMAEQFLRYSNDIQIFISTHSPAFYSLHNKSDLASCFFVDRNDKGFTIANDVNKIEIDLDSRMGILAYIAPILEEKNAELKSEKEARASLQEELSKLNHNAKYLVFTEDSGDDLIMIQTLMEAHGCTPAETAYLSYAGKDNYAKAVFACKMLISEKFKRVEQVIFHKDRDVDDDNDLNLPSNYYLFITKGYDLDSHFINKDHILSIYPDLSKVDLDAIIEESLDQAKDKSISKIADGLYQAKMKTRKATVDETPSKLFKKAQELYQSDKFRFSYGKTVLGILKGKLQHKTVDKTFNIFKPTKYLIDKDLTNILNK